MNEIQVVITPELGHIGTNFEELKTAVADYVKEFETAEFSEESKTIAKKVVANLRKMKKGISDRRIEAKNKYMQPYLDLELKCNELDEIIDKPIANILKQVEQFEKKRKAERQKLIELLYKEHIGEVGEYLPLSAIQSDKWLNASTSEKSIRDDIINHATKVKNDLTVINTSQSEVKAEAIEVYKRSLELSKAMQHINDYEQHKAQVLAREEARRAQEEAAKAEQERQRIRDEERQRVAEEARIKAEAHQEAVAEVTKKITQPITDEVVTDAKVTAVYTVSAQAEEIEQIEMFLDSIGVAFSRKDM